MRQHRFLLVVVSTVVGMIGHTSVSEARRMASGITVDERYILPNDPAVKVGTLVSAELLARYVGTPLREEFHCFHMHDNGALGRITMYGLYNVAVGGSYSADVFKGAVEATALRSIAQQNIEGAASYLVGHALRSAQGDPEKARQIIRAAEVRDAKCFSDIARMDRTSAELATKDRALQLAADGKWVVTMQIPGSGTRAIQQLVSLLKQNTEMVQMVERGYRAAYSELAARITTASRLPNDRAAPHVSNSKPEPSAPKGVATALREADRQPNPAPKSDMADIQDAAAQMRAALNAVRQSCLLKASVAQCG